MIYPSPTIWGEVADKLGCDLVAIKAVFEVEAAGKFFDAKGRLVRRFEPHHFKHRDLIGFRGGWRDSLRLSTRKREELFNKAVSIDKEAAYRATSWGAPQIMGFNHGLCGYPSASKMVYAFAQSADEQIRAFAQFVKSANLDSALRSHDWLSFATGYNGSGQAPVYAACIASAYKRLSGEGSSPILRVGMSGPAVKELQQMLRELQYDLKVDGVFGAETLHAVKNFQKDHDLKVDGVVGAATFRALQRTAKARIPHDPTVEVPTAEQTAADHLVSIGSTVVGSGGVAGLLSSLNETAQNIVVGGLVAVLIVVVAVYAARKLRVV